MTVELYKATLSNEEHVVCRDLSLVANAGERVALTGGCRTDRTLVLQAMLGMHGLDSGWMCLDGEPMQPQVAARFRHEIAYMPRAIDIGAVIVEDVASIMFNERQNKSCHARVDDVAGNLALLGVGRECLRSRFSDLDTATSQRALIALTFLFERPVALLDDPMSEQDEHGRAIVADYMRSSRFDDVAMVVATDDMQLMSICDRIVEFQ